MAYLFDLDFSDQSYIQTGEIQYDIMDMFNTPYREMILLEKEKFTLALPRNKYRLRPFIDSYLGVPIVSADIRKIIEESGHSQIQYIPIELAEPSGKVIADDYFVLHNLLMIQGAVNNELSDITWYDEKRCYIKLFRNIVLNSQKINNIAIFTIREKISRVFLSNKVVQKIKKRYSKEDLKYCNFIDCNEPVDV